MRPRNSSVIVYDDRGARLLTGEQLIVSPSPYMTPRESAVGVDPSKTKEHLCNTTWTFSYATRTPRTDSNLHERATLSQDDNLFLRAPAPPVSNGLNLQVEWRSMHPRPVCSAHSMYLVERKRPCLSNTDKERCPGAQGAQFRPTTAGEAPVVAGATESAARYASARGGELWNGSRHFGAHDPAHSE